MKKIAITGNIASGKSQAEKLFFEMGYPVYDSDDIAHAILEEMTEFYGYDVFINGKIDRKKLGSLVFSNPDARKNLESIIHPQVKKKILEIFQKHISDKLVFVSVPLLYEAGFNTMFDKILLIAVDETLQLSRLMQRNNLTKEEALCRMNSQMPQKEKIKAADYVIYNNSSIKDLNIQLYEFIEQILK